MQKLKRIKTNITNNFKNLSIQRKMIVSLVVCVILPIIILGLASTNFIARLYEQNQYEIQVNQLTSSGRDIERIYNNVIQEAARLAGQSSIQALASGDAGGQDYVYAARYMEESSDSVEYCDCITLSKNQNIIIQRGDRYINDDFKENQIDQLSYWLEDRELVFQRGINSYKSSVISYHTAVLNKLLMRQEGMISLYLDKEEMMSMLTPYQGQSFKAAILYDGQGRVIASLGADTNISEEMYWDTLREKGGNEYGYFQVSTEGNSEMILYTACGNSGWHLIQVENKLPFYNVQLVFIITAIIVCVLFGVTYGYLQNRTMIIPLRRLSHRIDVVKSGQLERQNYVSSQDEIGKVSSAFEDMVERVKDLIDQVYKETIKRQDAEREALLAKMNPHFLYNSLDSIHWLAYKNKDYQVSEQLEALADVYRHILHFGENVITIRDELEFLDKYLYLLESQLGERVSFLQDIPEDLYTLKIPKLIIQPLVENAVQHGMRNKSNGGKIKIRMRKRETTLVLWVIDNGEGCDAASVMELVKNKNGNQAFALRNIDERVQLRYGEEYGLRIYSKSKMGCIVKVTMQLES